MLLGKEPKPCKTVLHITFTLYLFEYFIELVRKKKKEEYIIGLYRLVPNRYTSYKLQITRRINRMSVSI